MFIEGTFLLQKDQTQKLEFLGDYLQYFNVCVSWEKLGSSSHSLGTTNNVYTLKILILGYSTLYPPTPQAVVILHYFFFVSTDTLSTLMTTPLCPIVPSSLNWWMPSSHLCTLTFLTLTTTLRVPLPPISSSLDSGIIIIWNIYSRADTSTLLVSF